MVDAEHLKTQVDLRLVVEQYLGNPVTRGAKAWNFKCPFHHESKGASLAVYADGWKCWGACQTGGDLYGWIAQWHNLDMKRDFRRILAIASGDLAVEASVRPTQPHPVSQAMTEPPSLAWQAAGLAILEQAEKALWSPIGRSALDYLVHQRGLWPHTIQEARLGYIPESLQRTRILDGLVVPTHSITIPWFAEGILWGIKCRRLAEDEPRYKEVSTAREREETLGKSNLSGALYWADLLVPRQPVLVVEGEFNCLAAWEAAGHLLKPVSLGASGRALNARWFTKLVTAPTLLAWFDDDTAGHGGFRRLADLSGMARTIALPPGVGKDIDEFWATSKRQEQAKQVCDWFEEVLVKQRESDQHGQNEYV